jgi:hypothetical protein
MKEMLVGGGVVDLLTLHPLMTVLGLAVVAGMARIALRGVAVARRGRQRGALGGIVCTRG